MSVYVNNGKQVLFQKSVDGELKELHIADAANTEVAGSISVALNERSPNFIKNALRTKSPNFYGEQVSRREFVAAINNFIDAANKLDKVKKSLFYGKDNNLDPRDGEQSANELPMRFGDTEPAVAIDLIHGVIGKATESGELLEALREAINEGKPLDFVNVNEEIGDGFWYDAILLHHTGDTFEEIQGRIISKLRARFPEAYSDEKANVRDLDTERAILEGPVAMAATPPVSGGEAVRAVAAGASAAFANVANTPAAMVDAPVTEGQTGGELHLPTGARSNPMPGEHLAHQRVRREDT